MTLVRRLWPRSRSLLRRLPTTPLPQEELLNSPPNVPTRLLTREGNERLGRAVGLTECLLPGPSPLRPRRCLLSLPVNPLNPLVCRPNLLLPRRSLRTPNPTLLLRLGESRLRLPGEDAVLLAVGEGARPGTLAETNRVRPVLNRSTSLNSLLTPPPPSPGYLTPRAPTDQHTDPHPRPHTKHEHPPPD